MSAIKAQEARCHVQGAFPETGTPHGGDNLRLPGEAVDRAAES